MKTTFTGARGVSSEGSRDWVGTESEVSRSQVADPGVGTSLVYLWVEG